MAWEFEMRWNFPNWILLVSIGWSMAPAQDVHFVRPGDTFWDLAVRYRTSGLDWPQIWEANPHIRDPHWIYPGDEIRLAAKDGVEVAADNRSFEGKVKLLERDPAGPPTLPTGVADGSRSRIREEIFRLSTVENTGSAVPFLLSQARIMALRKGCGRPEIDGRGEVSIYLPYDEIEIHPGGLETTAPGQRIHLLEVMDNLREFESDQDLGRRIEVRALAEVVLSRPDRVLARLVRVFGPLSRRCLAVLSRDVPTSDDHASEARDYPPACVVFSNPDDVSTLPYSYLILDAGWAAGFDHLREVQLYDRDPPSPSPSRRKLGWGIVVFSSRQSATVLVKGRYPGRLDRGDFALCGTSGLRKGS